MDRQMSRDRRRYVGELTDGVDSYRGPGPVMESLESRVLLSGIPFTEAYTGPVYMHVHNVAMGATYTGMLNVGGGTQAAWDGSNWYNFTTAAYDLNASPLYTPAQAVARAATGAKAGESGWGLEVIDVIYAGLNAGNNNIVQLNTRLWETGTGGKELVAAYFNRQDLGVQFLSTDYAYQAFEYHSETFEIWEQPSGTAGNLLGAAGSSGRIIIGGVLQDKYVGVGYDAAGNPLAGATLVLSGIGEVGYFGTLAATTGTSKFTVIGGTGSGTADQFYSVTGGTDMLFWDTNVFTPTKAGGIAADLRIHVTDSPIVSPPSAAYDWLTSSSDPLTGDRTIPEPVTIGNFVWNDTNGNGIQDAGEPGINGVSVTVTYAGPDGIFGNGDDTSTTLTTATVGGVDGQYSYTGAPGNYKVSVGTPAGYTPTATGQGTTATDSNPSPSGTTPSPLPSGGSDQTIDFGFYQPVTIGNFVWNDLNGNGVQDAGEPGIAGVTLSLSGTDGAGNAVSATTTTGTGGLYQFTEPPGTYTVSVVTPAGYTPTAMGQGTTATDSNPSPSGTTPSPLPSGGSDQTIDFGFYQPVTIGNLVWNDLNGNGVQDAGEPGIKGVTLTLIGTDGAGNPVSATTTDVNGAYLFTEAPGTYSVAVTTPAGYTPTATGQGTTATDSNVNPSGTTPVALPSGGSDDTIDLGYYQPVTIGDFVWNDLNGNGVQDAGEPGIAGVTLNLSGTDGAGNPVSATTTTDVNGAYLFTEAPGTYSVAVTTPAGYTPTATGQGTTATDSNVNPSGTTPVALPSGGSDDTIDFGYYQPAAIGDFVWEDLNANGLQDAGEPGIDGITVNLYDAGNNLVATQPTSGGGQYLFAGLTPGNYHVEFDAVTGFVRSPQDQGGDDAVDSDANASGVAIATTLLSGETDRTWDAGYYHGGGGPPASIELEKYAKSTTGHLGTEGLTPGFWKQCQHFQYWTGYQRCDSYNVVFGVSDAGGASLTLLGALERGGGGNAALGRHAVAALLNAAAPHIDYAFSTSEVIALVRYAYATGNFESVKNVLEAQNSLEGDYVGGDKETFTLGFDADDPPGPTVPVGSQIIFNYVVTDPGQTLLENIRLTDDNATPSLPADDFVPSPVQAGGFNAGDTDHDGLLDPGEAWQYIAVGTVTAGQHCNTATVVGTPVGSDGTEDVSDSDQACWNASPSVLAAITGHKFRDLSGNGLTADDTPLGGTTIRLFLDRNGDGVLTSSGDGPAVATAMTAAGTGEYAFDGLQPSRYFVQEVTPDGYVRTTPATTDYYTVQVAAGTSVTGIDFANFLICPCRCRVTNVSYLINGTATVYDLRGNTNANDLVQATFTVTSGSEIPVSLVTYTAPDSYYDANHAGQQVVFDYVTGMFGPGTYTLTVQIPNSNYQIDFICGWVLEHLGPAGSNIFYTPQGRLISADNDGNQPVLANPAALAGFVYMDANNDGVKQDSEVGIGMAKVTLTGNGVSLTRLTKPDGSYKFDNLRPGTYTVTESPQPAGYADGKDAVGTLGGTLGNDVVSGIQVGAGQTGTGYDFGEIVRAAGSSSLAGFVYIDFNDDGEVDFGEDGIAGAKVTLTGTDDLGAVTLMTQTDEDGEYSFTGLRPGTYVITETQPSAFLDGQDTPGTLGGTPSNDVFAAIPLAAGVNGLNYNFGERPKADGCVRCGQTATIGFWQNKNGQNLIKALNGGCSSTQLGNWLAETFPNLYGSLAGKTNTQVAQFYTSLFTAKTSGGMKLECQVMAAALATYVTNSTLAGFTAQRYGFCVTTYGAGNSTYNIGSAGAAFGVANNTRMTVLNILLATNDRSANGKVCINQSSALRSLVNAVYTGINEAGDIS